MRHRGPVPVVALAGTVLVAASLWACGDDSASSQVCDARRDLEESVSEAADAAAAGNLDDAGDELDDVREDYDELQSALGELSEDERQELAPQVDDIEAQIGDLGDAESLEDLGARADDLLDDTGSILGQITDDLDC
jgi:uncharacterized protein (DUF3084 family)